MKKYILLFSFTAVLIGALTLFSHYNDKRIGDVSIIKPQTMNYIETLTLNGILEPQKKNEISVDMPIVPEKVNVDVGQKVEIGDILATIDINATKDAILNLASKYSDLIPQDVLKTFKSLDLEGLLKSGAVPTEILSTASGRITNLSLSEGSIVLPESTVAVISDTNKLRVRFFASETEVEKIKVGSEVLFKANALKNNVFSSTIVNIAPTAYQRLSGLNYDTVVDVVANVDNAYRDLKAGYNVKGEIPVEQEREVVVLPYEVIFQDDNGEEYVYIYDNKKAIKKKVITGKEFSTSVEILSGISKDDKIIYGKNEPKDGQIIMGG